MILSHNKTWGEKATLHFLTSWLKSCFTSILLHQWFPSTVCFSCHIDSNFWVLQPCSVESFVYVCIAHQQLLAARLHRLIVLNCVFCLMVSTFSRKTFQVLSFDGDCWSCSLVGGKIIIIWCWNAALTVRHARVWLVVARTISRLDSFALCKFILVLTRIIRYSTCLMQIVLLKIYIAKY